MKRSARLDRTKRYRYQLERAWGDGSTLCFVGLNPSTADATLDDPTLRRVMGFARSWGHERVLVVNLFGWRSPSPKDLLTAEDPVGPSNDRWISSSVRQASRVLVGWGATPFAGVRAKYVLGRFVRWGISPVCLGTTKGGHPRHPLYVPKIQRPEPYEAMTSS